MRIAYLIAENINEQAGVRKKIEQQIQLWRSNGHDVKLFCFQSLRHGFGVESTSDFPHDHVLFAHKSMKLLQRWGFLANYANFVLSTKDVVKELMAFRADIIYARQSIGFPGIGKIFRCAPTIVEINTNDLEEIKSFNRFYQFIYKSQRKRYFSNVKGLICVTNELKGLYISSGVPIETIANGIDTTNLQKNLDARLKIHMDTLDKRPTLIFIGSPRQSWQGFDKFVSLARSLPEFDFDLIGPDRESLDGLIPSNLCVHGFLRQNSIAPILLKADIGVGSLALYRKGMDEACPLKVREYLLYGLPVVLGFKDTDLDNQDFVLNIGNHESNIDENLIAIKSFVLANWKLPVNLEKVYSLLDIRGKESKRLNFLKSIAANGGR